jgi:hypothetical protein
VRAHCIQPLHAHPLNSRNGVLFGAVEKRNPRKVTRVSTTRAVGNPYRRHRARVIRRTASRSLRIRQYPQTSSGLLHSWPMPRCALSQFARLFYWSISALNVGMTKPQKTCRERHRVNYRNKFNSLCLSLERVRLSAIDDPIIAFDEFGLVNVTEKAHGETSLGENKRAEQTARACY